MLHCQQLIVTQQLICFTDNPVLFQFVCLGCVLCNYCFCIRNTSIRECAPLHPHCVCRWWGPQVSATSFVCLYQYFQAIRRCTGVDLFTSVSSPTDAYAVLKVLSSPPIMNCSVFLFLLKWRAWRGQQAAVLTVSLCSFSCDQLMSE